MLTAIISLEYVHGAQLWLAGFLVCALLYLLLNSLRRANRSRRGFGILLAGLLVAEALCDAAWYFLYYPEGEYVNLGIGASMGLFLWPCLLVLLSVIVNAVNYDR